MWELGKRYFTRQLASSREMYAHITFEDSGDLLETQSALDHESQTTPRAYVHTVAVKEDKHNDK